VEGGTQTVATRADAVVLARSMEGVVLLSEDPSGSVITFRDGRELEGEEATQATLDFMDRGSPMREAHCAHPGCDRALTHHAWGWVDIEGLRGWALLQWCSTHFDEVEPGLRHAARTGHAVLDGPMPTEKPGVTTNGRELSRTQQTGSGAATLRPRDAAWGGGRVLKLRKSKEQRDAERRAREAVWAEEDAAIKREAQAQLPSLFSEAAVGGRCPKGPHGR
jgi:hypothetical protein